MTPCEKLGYKVGDRFEVVVEGAFMPRDLVELVEDDGSCSPYFGRFGRNSITGQNYSYVGLEKVKKIESEPFALLPGMYVSTEGMSEEQYHQVAKAFMAAGCGKGEYPEAGWVEDFDYFGWDENDILEHTDVFFENQGEHEITITQALSTLEEEWVPVNGEWCVLEDAGRVKFIGFDGEGLAVIWNGGYHPVLIGALSPIPAKSEREIAVEEMMEHMARYGAKDPWMAAADLYEAGYRKQ